MSVADDLINLKELLDEGIITQEEFELKKKELLGEGIIETNNNIHDNDEEYIENDVKKQKRKNMYRMILNVIGIVFIVGGAGELVSNKVISGIITILIGLVILPLFSEYLWNKFKIEISSKLKIIICIVLLCINSICEFIIH